MTSIRIGRQRDNDLSFDPKIDISVSGYHAEIYRDGERYFIKDLQSRNGTLVNSRKIDKPVQLKDGDVIQLSARGPKLSFSTKDPSAVAEVSEAQSPESAPTEIFTMERKEQAEPKARVGAGAWESVASLRSCRGWGGSTTSIASGGPSLLATTLVEVARRFGGCGACSRRRVFDLALVAAAQGGSDGGRVGQTRT